MHHVTLEEAKHSLLTLIQNVIKGEEIVITQDEKPVAKLISAFKEDSTTPLKIKAGSAKGLIKIADDFDEPIEDFMDYME
jgi:antitoxin (DNA-binding transcriptional repressor) of toxin-antitoxin stability system